MSSPKKPATQTTHTPNPDAARFTPQQEAGPPADRTSMRFEPGSTPKYCPCPILGNNEFSTPSPHPKPGRGQVPPTARSLASGGPNINTIRTQVHLESTVLHRFGKPCSLNSIEDLFRKPSARNEPPHDKDEVDQSSPENRAVRRPKTPPAPDDISPAPHTPANARSPQKTQSSPQESPAPSSTHSPEPHSCRTAP